MRRVPPGADDDAWLREAVAIANIPTLIVVLVQLTGELGWLDPPYRPRRNRGLGDNPTGGLPDAVQAEIREAAYDAVETWRRGRPVAIPDPPDDLLVRMLSVSMGEDVPAEYGPMLAHELERAEPGVLRQESLEVPSGFRVLIIGAGVSGLAAGARMRAAGVDFTILERRQTVGGTWLENRYPGAGVDTPSALYSFSFAPYDWSKYFALRDELQAYLEHVADAGDVRKHIRFGTEVLGAAYDDAAQAWWVTARAPDGRTETLRANVLVTAVGGFNKPKWPLVAGLEDFAGPCVHTARWPDDLEIDGRRVAVIGNGASAMQLVPAIAGTAASVTVFQRSPQWAAPFELLHAEVPQPLRRLAREVPLYRTWYRLRAGWTFNDRLHESLQKDPSWPHPERSLNAVNDAHRRFFLDYVESQLGDRPDLMAKVVPDYPPYGKRILLDNGWYQALRRDDVELVTDHIAQVRADGVLTAAGDTYEVDVIACATGFDVVRFLAPMDIRGRSGRSLRETWDDDDARAYLGLAVPDYPNLFVLYGPNIQGGHGGSLIASAEAQVDYVMDVLGQMLRRGVGAVECRREVYEGYSRRVDEAHEAMVWTHPGMETYYRNTRGRVVVPTPFRVVDFWRMTRNADLGDFLIETGVGRGTAAPA